MARLFISLYLLLILSIGAINWLSEKLWQHYNQQPSAQIIAIEQVANSLALTLNANNLTALSDRLSLPIVEVAANDIALLPWQHKELNNLQPVLTSDEHENIYAYVLRSQQLYRVGPFKHSHDTSLIKPLIFLVSYLCLALFIALWIYPLWRDLKRLERSSIAFSQGAKSAPMHVNNGSVIAPILHTFNSMTAQISRLISDQKQLTNAVSHEIRTPLSRLKFAFAMLDQKAVPQLDSMRQDVAELEQLVDEMLNYGRLESQSDKLHMEDVNISDLANHLIDKLTRHSELSVIRNIDDNLVCHCDGHLIERALQNYITNALRYATSSVAIRITNDNENLVFDVEDDGEGIAKEQRELVFDAFTRLDKSRNKENGGFGLGLAIVKRIVQWHQGQCYVTDSQWQGAKFSLKLPKISSR